MQNSVELPTATLPTQLFLPSRPCGRLGIQVSEVWDLYAHTRTDRKWEPQVPVSVIYTDADVSCDLNYRLGCKL